MTTKDKIIDVAVQLFAEEGYEATSIESIIETVGIAKGTLYHHFKSKKEIMNEVIERITEQMLQQATMLASDFTDPPLKRLVKTVQALNMQNQTDFMEHLHDVENFVLHQKIQMRLFEELPQILLPIIEDGIEEGIMRSDYPLESIELIISYAILGFDQNTDAEKSHRKINAFLFNIERIFQMEPGALEELKHM